MKKNAILTLLFILTITITVKAQIVTIPDTVFKAYLVADTNINTNLNSEIEVSEATAFTGSIEVDYLDITDLTGIEAFVNLTLLRCIGNSLTTLDVSANTALTILNCSSNSLTSLVVNTNTALTYFGCDNNSISSLDVTTNTALKILSCYSNQLSSLDVNSNTALTTLSCSYNSLASLDLSTNTALTSLQCNYNSIASLDLTANTALTFLSCNNNSLTSLTVSANTGLTLIQCGNNSISSLDVNTNTALITLTCNNNSITSLDVSANTGLTLIQCGNNSISSLDLSTNTALTKLSCNNNLLTTLNLANGMNTNFNSTLFNLTNNPYLSCIQVDNPTYMYNNFGSLINKDANAVYGINCFYDTEHNKISGTIHQDQDSNCVGENILYHDILIKDTRGYYAVIDTNGNYTLKTDSGTAIVEQLFTNPFIKQTCFNGGSSIVFDSSGEDTAGVDFYNILIECPLLNIDVISNRRRRCFDNHTYINYANVGSADETNVEVVVLFPDYVHFVSADLAHTIDPNGNFVFNIGNLAQGESGEIHIIDSVACENGITGLTQCTRAWITPINDCINNLDTTIAEWDKSSVAVSGNCINDSVIQFVIYNTGDLGNGDMQGLSEYRIYVDNLLAFTSTFQLAGEDSLIIEVPANGQTIRLEADQRFGHPGNSLPRETIEACGNGGVPIVLGMPLQAQLDNLDYEVAEDCLDIIDSYDPNDKKAMPAGFTTNRFVHPESRINYTVRFQNTGTDTAYTVIVVDTLSQYLDLATIRLGTSLHVYNLEIRRGDQGQPVLMFTFNEIDLVDSLTNEGESNGFFSYSIKAIEGTVNNTIIHNSAEIYFDYNLPITTNDSWITISDTMLSGTLPVVEETKSIHELDGQVLMVYPNPFNESIMLTLPTGLNCSSLIKIFDLVGKQVYSASTSTTAVQIDGSLFVNGVYLVELSNKNMVIGRRRIVKY